MFMKVLQGRCPLLVPNTNIFQNLKFRSLGGGGDSVWCTYQLEGICQIIILLDKAILLTSQGLQIYQKKKHLKFKHSCILF